MNFLNPFFVNPAPSDDAEVAEKLRPVVLQWLQKSKSEKISLTELRAGLPECKGQLTRPVVNQILQDLGAEIENPEDETV